MCRALVLYYNIEVALGIPMDASLKDLNLFQDLYNDCTIQVKYVIS